MGFPEGNVPGSELGLGQFANLLSLEGLTYFAIDGRAVPRLAESWEWEEDYLRLRVKLRPNVSFHDGTAMTASIAAGILREAVAQPSTRASYSSLGDVVSVRTEGELELVLDLSRKSAFLPEDLTLPLAIAPGVGTGPYRLTESDKSHLSFERFEAYYAGLPAIDEIQVRTFDALRTAWTSLLRGEVDMVTDVPAEAVEFVKTPDVDVITYKRWYQFMVAFNSSERPFRSPAVRQALNVAVDRNALIQRALKGYASPSTGPLWPQHWAYDSSIPTYPFDQRLAAALLDGAGFRPQSDRGNPLVPNARLRFTCLLPANFSILERIGLELQKQLYDVGVDMQFEVVPLAEYNTRILEGRFQAVLIDMISGPSFGRSYIFWRSAKNFRGLNVFGYENSEAERLFEQLREAPANEAAVRSATHSLQRVFLEDPPALFVAWNERTRAVRSSYVVVREPNRDPMLTLAQWKSRENTTEP